MKLIFTLVAFLACVAVAWEFPGDPSGVDVIDRGFFQAYREGEELWLYLTLFNSEGRGTVKIDELMNGEWKTVCLCNPRNHDDEFMVFNPITVFSIDDHGGNIIQISWIDAIYDYHEGMVSFYILYDYVMNECEDGWVD